MWPYLETVFEEVIQFSSVAQSCLTLCDPMSCSMPGLPVHHQLPESTQPLSIESVMPSNHLYIHRCKRLWGTYQWQQFKAKKLGRSDESGIIAAKVEICAVRRPHSSSKPLTHCTYIYIRQPTCGHQPCWGYRWLILVNQRGSSNSKEGD